MSRVSVLIPTYRRQDNLMHCLDSLSKQSHQPDEILIIDGDDTNQLQIHLRDYLKGALNYKIIKAPKGLTRQRNAGIKEASGEIIIFIDDDVILDKDYIKEIISVFQRFPERIGGVSGSVEVRDISVNPVLRLLMHIYAKIFLLYREGNGKFQASGFATRLKDCCCKEAKPAEFLFGCNMAFRKEIFKEFQFDENLYRYMYMEDDDFAYRLSRKYQNYFTPAARVIHLGPSEKRDDFVRAHALIKNFFYLHKKNFPKTIKYELAFFWALTGWVFIEFTQALFFKKIDRIRGLFAGLKEECPLNKISKRR
ncbi:MAG: glycosyltransferase [Candidatus Omnitrophica bacterium]|nr:glycosyltransferase [Candidatus Omnitrophota bacterium]